MRSSYGNKFGSVQSSSIAITSSIANVSASIHHDLTKEDVDENYPSRHESYYGVLELSLLKRLMSGVVLVDYYAKNTLLVE